MNFRKLKLLIVSTSLLSVTGCATTGIQTYKEFVPSQSSIHTMYPIQFSGQPKTPNERLQAKSRGATKLPIFVCSINNKVKMTIIGKMIRITMNDKKIWPEYGFITRDVTMTNAYDNSINYKVYISFEINNGRDRNTENGDYAVNQLVLNWNSEKVNNEWMHGTARNRGTEIYVDHRRVSFKSSQNEIRPLVCDYMDLSNAPDLLTLITLETMTTKQKDFFQVSKDSSKP